MPFNAPGSPNKMTPVKGTLTVVRWGAIVLACLLAAKVGISIYRDIRTVSPQVEQINAAATKAQADAEAGTARPDVQPQTGRWIAESRNNPSDIPPKVADCVAFVVKGLAANFKYTGETITRSLFDQIYSGCERDAARQVAK